MIGFHMTCVPGGATVRNLISRWHFASSRHMHIWRVVDFTPSVQNRERSARFGAIGLLIGILFSITTPASVAASASVAPMTKYQWGGSYDTPVEAEYAF